MSDINQDDIDKLLQDALVGGGDAAAPEAESPSEEDRGPASQDDIDALFAAVGVDADPAAAAPAAAPKPEPEPPAATPEAPPAEQEADLDGVANQDDIDALFAAVGDAQPAAETAPEPPAPEAEDDDDLDGVANQDDIDALFSAVGAPEAEAPAPEAAPEAPAAAETPAPAALADDEDLSGVADQNDIDALFSAAGVEDAPLPAEDADVPEPGADAVDDAGPMDQDDIAAMFDSQLAEVDAAADREASEGDEELDALLSSITGETPEPDEPEPEPETEEAEEAEEAEKPPEPADESAGDQTAEVDIDMDELLRQVSEAAPPPPPAKPKTEVVDQAADTTILDMTSPDISQALAEAGMMKPPPAPPPAAPKPAASPTPSAPPATPAAPPAAPAGRREYSVLYGAGEVESMANQISALISALSEKAHGYMQAWIAADSEAKELRTRALGEERRRLSMETERNAMAKQLDELRARLAEIEGKRVAGEESQRTLETTYQARVRELENRVKMLGSEVDSLKDELGHARNQATGVDLESRRNRFEADRLKNELESERMERLRIQRALENREKEIQALQTQSAGQASSLFIDELHRLVRRLESELDARSSGANEALRQLDRLEASEDMVPVVANLRASLMQAMGADDNQDDALKSLGREASGIKGPAAVAPGKAELVSFETALATYNLNGAIDVAGALLREARASTGLLMRKIYQCPALRRPEVSPYLDDLARLLDGLRTVQESSDRSRGKETGESEVFYVHMFDFLHNLVRLKLINRLSGEIWRLFLDLRGRFSFVTSDKQWAEYRDNTLNDYNTKG